ncbi:hypothetical protein APHAL10511_003079 [Amanita phalloides]|nr:hypothetical protein APHAL10511_003079 [Amanita phalloides]
MAATDLFALLTTLVIVGVVIYVVLYVSRGFHDTVQTTKESLKSRGFDVSGSGISIKTDKRFDREAYLDATQRGMVSMLGAASIGDKPVLTNGRLNSARAQPPTTRSTSVEKNHESHGTTFGRENIRSKKFSNHAMPIIWLHARGGDTTVRNPEKYRTLG